ncbi:hypothetical protein MG293_000762, partial [Ovis ammon polii]
ARVILWHKLSYTFSQSNPNYCILICFLSNAEFRMCCAMKASLKYCVIILERNLFMILPELYTINSLAWLLAIELPLLFSCPIYKSQITFEGKALGDSAAADAKSLQSCPTLCDPIDGSPPGSPVPGIFQARTLEWVAVFFCVKVKSESEVTQSCLTLCDPMGCSLPGSSIHGIFQARVLEWFAIAFSDQMILVGMNL